MVLLEKKKEESNSDSLFDYYRFTPQEQKNYPIVAHILKEMTQERIKEEIEKIQKVELPSELKKCVKEYEGVAERDGYIWKWAYFGWHFFTLPCVDKKYKESVVLIKMYITMLNALIDDLADVMHDQRMLNNASDIIIKNTNKKLPRSYGTQENNYILLIRRLWNLINKNIEKYPRYREFKNILSYDYRQYLNTIQYSYLINEDPALINLLEHDIYAPHNMKMIIGSTIDLMCSPKFDHDKTGVLREVIWNSQQMGRIGNLLATWEDEIGNDNDLTSGIIAYTIEEKIVSINDLQKNKNTEKIVKKIKASEAEKHFLKQWENCYNNISSLSEKNKLDEAREVLGASRKFLIMHLTSRGLEV